jgi:hypothetical protein
VPQHVVDTPRRRGRARSGGRRTSNARSRRPSQPILATSGGEPASSTQTPSPLRRSWATPRMTVLPSSMRPSSSASRLSTSRRPRVACASTSGPLAPVLTWPTGGDAGVVLALGSTRLGARGWRGPRRARARPRPARRAPAWAPRRRAPSSSRPTASSSASSSGTTAPGGDVGAGEPGPLAASRSTAGTRPAASTAAAASRPRVEPASTRLVLPVLPASGLGPTTITGGSASGSGSALDLRPALARAREQQPECQQAGARRARYSGLAPSESAPVRAPGNALYRGVRRALAQHRPLTHGPAPSPQRSPRRPAATPGAVLSARSPPRSTTTAPGSRCATRAAWC